MSSGDLVIDKKLIEKRIVRLVIEGDQNAFADLYNLYSEKLYFFALRFLKTKEDAENITQDIFVKIWETRDRLDPEYSFSSYLFTIAKNTIFNIKRKKVNEQVYIDYLSYSLDPLHFGTDKEVMLNDLQNNIDRSVEVFPPQRKKIFELSRRDGLSHKEISQQLNISEKTIETHIRLALIDLRKTLSDHLVTLLIFSTLAPHFFLA